MCLRHCQESTVGSCPFHSNGHHDELDEDHGDTNAINCPPPILEPLHDQPPSQGSGMHELHATLEIALAQRAMSIPTSQPLPFPSLHDILHHSLPAESQATSQPTSSSQPLMSSPPPTTSSSVLPSPPTCPIPSHQPRITKQLDDLWLANLAARGQQEVEARHVEEQRQAREHRSCHHFCLNWFDKVRTLASDD